MPKELQPIHVKSLPTPQRRRAVSLIAACPVDKRAADGQCRLYQSQCCMLPVSCPPTCMACVSCRSAAHGSASMPWIPANIMRPAGQVRSAQISTLPWHFPCVLCWHGRHCRSPAWRLSTQRCMLHPPTAQHSQHEPWSHALENFPGCWPCLITTPIFSRRESLAILKGRYVMASAVVLLLWRAAACLAKPSPSSVTTANTE